MQDRLIKDFRDIRFKKAFQLYFRELGLDVQDWDSLFAQMNQEANNAAYLRISDTNETVGFVMFQPVVLSDCFFREQFGFIREFWVQKQYRNKGNGTALLLLAEQYFLQNNIMQTILTTDTADLFYQKNGYIKAPQISAKNQLTVYQKQLNKTK